MKIAIDARMVRTQSMHGIARYVVELLSCIREMDRSDEFYIFCAHQTPLLDEAWPENFHFIKVDANWISLSEQWEIPKLLTKYEIDVFHAPSFVAPILCPCKMIMTIHDLNHLGLPQFYTPIHQIYYKTLVKYSIAKSSRVLTVSHFSKEQIVHYLNLPEEKICVTYNGVSERFKPLEDEAYAAYVRFLYQLPNEFILCVSNNKPHKNVHQLVRAYCYANIETPLVLACPVEPQMIEIAENYGKKHNIYFTKYISEEHLAALYSMAKLFVYPSTYEGFGLPPLEALACGTPVVVANSSSLPEVVGDAAVFAEPYDFQDIARALELGLNDDSLRKKLVSKGMMRSKHFSWKKMTELTLNTYHECFDSKSVEGELATS